MSPFLHLKRSCLVDAIAPMVAHDPLDKWVRASTSSKSSGYRTQSRENIKRNKLKRKLQTICLLDFRKEFALS
eukprot:3138987-Karenia_brevis.AAC.1